MKIVKFRTSSNDKAIVETISHFLIIKKFAVSVHIKEGQSPRPTANVLEVGACKSPN